CHVAATQAIHRQSACRTYSHTGFRRGWPRLAQQAASGEDSFADFLEKLLAAETDARSERSRQALLKTAALPAVKTLEQYDFAFATGVPRAQLQELAALSFVGRAENIVF
ncbi:Transposase/IS protein, partial [Pseudomonas amygdali pv. dendropanacis]